MSDYSESLTRRRGPELSDTDAFRLFVASQIGWLAVSIPTVTSFGITSIESLFIVAFVGFLAACLLFEPVGSDPRWWRVSRWLTRGGFVVLGYWALKNGQELGIWMA